MGDGRLQVDEARAVDRLMRFLSVEGITGEEAKIARAVKDELIAIGVPRRAIQFDEANQQIPLPTQTGNLIVTLSGTRPGPRRLFSTHLDTVPLCAGAKPVRRANRIVSASETALGGDNRAGVGCLVTLLATLVEQKLPHPPLTVLFTVREESGLWGARHVDLKRLDDPVEGFNFDGRGPADVILGAVGADRWEVEIRGRASHAGVYPERGVSAAVVAALALSEIYRDGWFGKVKRDGREGTSNVGVLAGKDGGAVGAATNIVMDYMHLYGESRSHDAQFVKAITTAYRDAFQQAAEHVRSEDGVQAKVRFHSRRDYYPFRLKPNTPVVRHAISAIQHSGLEPKLRATNGGLDANWLVRHGIPTVTFGVGQNNVHAIGEYVDVPDYLSACRVAVALATQPD